MITRYFPNISRCNAVTLKKTWSLLLSFAIKKMKYQWPKEYRPNLNEKMWKIWNSERAIILPIHQRTIHDSFVCLYLYSILLFKNYNLKELIERNEQEQHQLDQGWDLFREIERHSDEYPIMGEGKECQDEWGLWWECFQSIRSTVEKWKITNELNEWIFEDDESAVCLLIQTQKRWAQCRDIARI